MFFLRQLLSECAHWVTWRHRCRHQSTRRKHFPIGSLLDMNP